MIIIDILYGLFIAPIELLLEIIFSTAYHITQNAGAAIALLSLAVNFLVLPLYRRADIIRMEERQKEARLKKWTDHIKKTFHGEEKYMMLQTYYRQNGYKQTDALKGSLSLLLEIPFFIAAYHFLSNLHLLDHAELGVIRDLSAPDLLLTIAGQHVNLLPVLMTLINLFSAAIYMDGFSLKNKLQTYGMAFIFLILLYPSPSGLVFYWTLNNVFSLFKNIYYKAKEKGKLRRPAKRAGKEKKTKKPGKPDAPLFLYNTILLAVLGGLLIPSAVIRSSVAEFMTITDLRSPVWIVLYAASYAVGIFVIWFGIFYRIAGDRGRKRFERVLWLFSCTAVIDYMFFGTDYGTLSSLLVYEAVPGFSRYMSLMNLGVLIAVWCVAFVIYRKKPAAVRFITVCVSLVLVFMSAFNLIKMEKDASALMKQSERIDNKEDIHFSLSKNGKNVIVIMLDRAIGGYIPYIMKEKPELQEKFAGFTWYPNTVSYGMFTLTGSPALYGGYEYTPESINARPDVLLKDKQNEALKVMPVLFDRNDYEVTVCDPTYAGYQWIPDLSIYDDYPDIKKYITLGKFDINSYYDISSLQKRNFFCYSLFRMAPGFMQSYIYDDGNYNKADKSRSFQIWDGCMKGDGYEADFLKAYTVLSKLSDMTQITSEGTNTFLMMSNDTTHEPALLQEPEYEPAEVVDNTPFETPDQERESAWGGQKISLANEYDMVDYHVNMASLLKLADWFDYMRENDVYNNTRIIIVADHATDTHTLNPAKERLSKEDPSKADPIDELNATRFNPVFLVKDFGSREFKVDEQFMTNADTPTLAFKNLIRSPVNPSTGNIIDDQAKESEQHISAASYDIINMNNGKTLLPADWYSVKHGDVYDLKNWKRIAENKVSP